MVIMQRHWQTLAKIQSALKSRSKPLQPYCKCQCIDGVHRCTRRLWGRFLLIVCVCSRRYTFICDIGISSVTVMQRQQLTLHGQAHLPVLDAQSPSSSATHACGISTRTVSQTNPTAQRHNAHTGPAAGCQEGTPSGRCASTAEQSRALQAQQPLPQCRH